ncbi:MBL fold metallo-hydrolase [Conexibacter sp. JD483]|uniref:MBL fold metallo-hydrolase n=1 Tax=unclassified Conexibacter TaxID=2627773 RepID=UPI0027224E4A|nr:MULTISPECIES: MBL fold metallo-hydrolase [unclassified Conexibacter]MDO8187153.1 MBL fold metallo-hydrolase [Conexibacter sp. CPCC 205706]MDO8200329.1 MBL fold metallo-hydrolase [Conexibacter sp. CPCC 205762]MDR9368875.1 MBL fold metallo-hydrolase [Conexibacter sp. JD483]
MRAIDVNHLGIERVICAWQVGDVIVDPGPEPALPTLLEALGDWRPRALLLTHIHLDHAGATGALVKRWPDLEVYVHERGAPHVIDPSKLMNSAGRLYGEDNMQRLWGDVLPVPQEQVHALSGGETLDLAGGIRVAYTPGHASHHVAYLHEESGRAFVGDVAGVRIPPLDLVIAPTPPPDVDVEKWEASLDLIGDWRPASLGLTHFGAVEDAAAQLDATRQSLRDLAGLARRGDADLLENAVRSTIEREADGPATVQAYEAAVPPSHLFMGLERYWRKRAEREAADASVPDGSR